MTEKDEYKRVYDHVLFILFILGVPRRNNFQNFCFTEKVATKT